MEIDDIIDAGIQCLADSEDDLVPHIIYCVGDYIYESEKFKQNISEKLTKYGIQSSILTFLFMERRHLITKEKEKSVLKNDTITIYDDVEYFDEKLRGAKDLKEELVESFFIPKLTEKELKMVEVNNRQHMLSYALKFNADVNIKEMIMSKSTDKYIYGNCHRKTVFLFLKTNQTFFEADKK